MEELETTVGSDINEALRSKLEGIEDPEEQKQALIELIKDYDKSVKEYVENLESSIAAKTAINNNLIFIVAIVSAIVWTGVGYAIAKMMLPL